MSADRSWASLLEATRKRCNMIATLTNIDSLYLALIFIVPGLIIYYVRAQFLTGRLQKPSESLLSYLALSLVYGSIAVPILDELVRSSTENDVGVFYWVLLILVGPAVFGLALGLLLQTNIFRWFLAKIHLNPVHAMPTAWDWKFSGMQGQLVLVTLKNNTKFAGYCGGRSFMSSEPGERDIYIEKIYRLGDNDSWSDSGHHSLLIAQGEISTIEFFPVTQKEE